MGIDLIAEIKKRTRDEWIQLLRDKWLDLRILVQENGELALVAGFAAGIFLVLAFKLVVAISVIAVLIFFLILNIADSESDLSAAKKKSDDYQAKNEDKPFPQNAESDHERSSSVSINGSHTHGNASDHQNN